jgi:N12 class adenine-specific DNA methylase
MLDTWSNTPLAMASTGEKAKAHDILAAIRTLKRIEEEHRPASMEEKAVMARFNGFGAVALSIFPDPMTDEFKDPSWAVVGTELKALLTEEEYASAKRTTFNAFYTSPVVVAAMHAALARMGVPESALVLEPGCGIGNFMAHAPRNMRFIGVELDRLSGRLTRALYPEHDIRIESFQRTSLPEDGVDAVIGNVPFADLKLDFEGRKLALHDYFFAKSLLALKDGGILALITSRFTLDKQNASFREYMASQADFLGAIRLPSDAFKREGTAVVTDILFLRKRAPNEAAEHAYPDWLRVEPVEVGGSRVMMNAYFRTHPHMVLGDLSLKNRLYADGFSVQSIGDLAPLLRSAILHLPERAYSATASPAIREKPRVSDTPIAPGLGEGSFFVDEEQVIRQVIDGRGEPVVYGGRQRRSIGSSVIDKRLDLLIRLRDRARIVLQSQNEDWPQAERVKARAELNWAYDAFTTAFGPINKTTFSENAAGAVIRRMPNLVKFREDPDAMLVMSLEDYDEMTGRAAKAPILLQDVVGKTPPITSVASAVEGLLVSLNRKGCVDLDYIAELYGKSVPEVDDELGDLIFHDPATAETQTADEYLSGNVRRKLAEAREAGIEPYIAALEAVQPEDVLPGDIDANLGAPWVPESDIQQFAAELFGVSADVIQIGHLKKDAEWSVEAEPVAERSVAATSDYGTQRANGTRLLELALNMKLPSIYDTIGSGADKQTILNQEATLAAREKQKIIKERFKTWAFTDPDRTERFVRLYNDTYNNLRPRLFDGSHLDFPGMSQTVALRQHQKDAIWRGMCAGNLLLSHVVGAGKTFVMAAIGMKMRQAGLVKKPMYVVPNHLLEQFAREFLQLYPNAKLLVAAKEDLSRDRRKHLTAKIASGDWDGIIVTHSSFERIGMSRRYQEAFLREQIAEYDLLLRERPNSGAARAHRNLIKTIEKQKLAREEKLKDLLAEDKKDDGLVFDEIGVDQLFIDEAQYYKNLETPTKMERVAGLQTTGSERAFDLFMKSRYLHQENPGRGLVFATGTPVSNTMVELYTMQRYLDPDGLTERGIDHFDAWAATFGEVVEMMEIAPDGASLRSRTRFAKFVNLPELQQMFRAFADVQTAEMLNLPRPELRGGKAETIASPMSETQVELQQKLVERYDRIRAGGVDPREDNALAITTDGRKLALDARLVSSTASDFSDSKINALVENVEAEWRLSLPNRGTQIIFCDMGVRPTEWGFSAYEDVVAKLVAAGIPEKEIAIIGDAESDAKKQALFAQVRTGSVRVLIGSTQKMGTGTNVQKRLVALHHLDAPWKPAEVEQRDGRILRQGNTNAEVAIYRYVTEGTFDAYMWQALETKARFIDQVMRGNIGIRRTEDIGGQELSYAEVKAIASGNPAVLTLAEADAELQRLSILARNHADEQFLARRRTRELPELIADQSDRLGKLRADAATVLGHAGDPVTVGNRRSHDKAHDLLAAKLDTMPRTVREFSRIPIGVYRGLRFGMVLHPQFPPELYLDGETVRKSNLSRDHHGPRAILNALERLAVSYPEVCDQIERDLGILKSQLEDFTRRIGQRFPHADYLERLTSLRDQLRTALSSSRSEEADAEPDAASIAAQIKSLQSSQTLRDPVDRPSNPIDTGEEPVTRRLLQWVDQTREHASSGRGR